MTSAEARNSLLAAVFDERLRAALLAEVPCELPRRPRRGASIARGRVVLRFRVSEATHRAYRGMEQVLRRHRPGEPSLLRFLCLALIDAWKHALPPRVAYGHIYSRDRFRCSSPVCTRRDVTPHHMRYRSRGGDDSDENVISLCVWCHLEGIHGGRLRASGSASAVRWEIGRAPHTVVSGHDRERSS
jgi:hypothetical protein